MSEMTAEAGGGMMSRRVMGIPMPVLLIGVAALGAYFLFFRKGTSAAPATGSSATGPVTIKPAPTTVNVNVAKPKVTKPRHKTNNPQPQHKPHRRRTTHHVKVPNKMGTGGAVSFR